MANNVTPKQIRLDSKIVDDLDEKTTSWLRETFYNGPCKVEGNSQSLSQYISFFDSLHLEPGYVLDAISGLIYTRKRDGKHMTSVEEYCEALEIDVFPSLADDEIYKFSRLNFIHFEKDPLGFYQFAKFCLDAPVESSPYLAKSS